MSFLRSFGTAKQLAEKVFDNVFKLVFLKGIIRYLGACPANIKIGDDRFAVNKFIAGKAAQVHIIICKYRVF